MCYASALIFCAANTDSTPIDNNVNSSFIVHLLINICRKYSYFYTKMNTNSHILYKFASKYAFIIKLWQIHARLIATYLNIEYTSKE